VEPVLSDTPKEHETGSDCKGCRNTQAFILVNRNTGNKFALDVGKLRCWIAQVPLYIFLYYYFI